MMVRRGLLWFALGLFFVLFYAYNYTYNYNPPCTPCNSEPISRTDTSKTLRWELDPTVDYYEIWLSETKDPGEGRLIRITNDNDVSCYVLVICHEVIYVHIRGVRGRVKGEFASIFWDKGLNTDAKSFQYEDGVPKSSSSGRSWISLGESVSYI